MVSPSPPSRLSHMIGCTMIRTAPLVFVLSVLSISATMSGASGSGPGDVPIYGVEIVNVFPHDPAAFTEGLLYTENDTLYESTGLYGNSSVRRVALQTGKVEDILWMDGEYFGEGLTLHDKRLLQVTWKMDTGFIYDLHTLSNIGSFTNHMKDGWGLATDEKVIFGTDGSSTLYHIDPHTLKVIEKHVVKYNAHEVPNLNELEYVNGEVWANIWQTDCIARMSSRDGSVLGWIYALRLRIELINHGFTGFDVLNGIAWDKKQKRIFMTGKLWPKLFEVKVHMVEEPFDIEKLCIRPPLN